MDLSFKAGLSQNQVSYIENKEKNVKFVLIFEHLQHFTAQPAVLFEPEDTERRKARETVSGWYRGLCNFP